LIIFNGVIGCGGENEKKGREKEIRNKKDLMCCLVGKKRWEK
jgi:hypothetical protein